LSRARNKLIVEAFYLTGDIEKYGSGYIRVREEIKEYPTMAFEYKESGDGYLVKLSYTEQKTTQKTTKEQILGLLKEDKKLTRDGLAKAIGVSSNAIKQHLSKLQNDKLLKRVGGRKDGYWEVLDD
jgi:ATP-dependent DNA helicase RecG